jgi:hypothetical protein
MAALRYNNCHNETLFNRTVNPSNMSDFTLISFKRPVSMIGICILTGTVTFSSCRTNRGYDPAALRGGAEYRFEEGLRKEKHPQYLFDKKTRKDQAEMGYPTGQPNGVPATTTGDSKTAGKAPVTAGLKPAAQDSMRTDSVYKVRPH